MIGMGRERGAVFRPSSDGGFGAISAVGPAPLGEGGALVAGLALEAVAALVVRGAPLVLGDGAPPSRAGSSAPALRKIPGNTSAAPITAAAAACFFTTQL